MEALRNSAFCSSHSFFHIFSRRKAVVVDLMHPGLVSQCFTCFNGPELGFGGLRQLQHEDLLFGGVWFAVRAALAASPGSWLRRLCQVAWVVINVVTESRDDG